MMTIMTTIFFNHHLTISFPSSLHSILVFSSIFVLLSSVQPANGSIDIELDAGPEAGLFFQLPSSSPPSSPSSDAINTKYFTILQSTQSMSVEAKFGPISVKQTIYPSLIESSLQGGPSSSSFQQPNIKAYTPWKTTQLRNESSSSSSFNYTEKQLHPHEHDLFTNLNPVPLELSAHLVTKEVKRNSPVLRVLFYSGHISHDQIKGADYVEKTLCAIVSVQKDAEKIYGSCSPTSSREGACLAQVTLPAFWWPPVDFESSSRKGQKPSAVKVDYILIESDECTDAAFLASITTEHKHMLEQVSSSQLGEVTLISFQGSYEEVTNDDIVRILIPQEPTYPNSKIYIPICFRFNPNYPLAAFSIRVRVKSGIRILGAQLSPSSPWQISVELNPKQTQATVTAYLRDEELQQDESQLEAEELFATTSQEVYSWLFEIDDNADFNDMGRIVWQLLYITDMGFNSAVTASGRKDFDRESSKLTSRLDIQKDEIQEVVGVTKSHQLLNTAVLTGKQISHSLRVFVISQTGRIGDVTLQSNCHSSDESILKVSPSCTSVYLDGSEIRGSQNASILIKYGTYTGHANFLIWMPKLPLEIRVSDTRLNQIKGWKTPHLKRKHHSSNHQSDSSFQLKINKTVHFNGHKRSLSHRNELSDESGYSSGDNDMGCRLRYQQTKVEVFTRFFSSDHNSGRESSLLSRKVAIQVTNLILSNLRISDPRIALLRGNIVEGLQNGRTEVQIVSPITGHVIGAKELRVSTDKDTITQLEINLVSGIHLEVNPDLTSPNVWIAKASLTEKLTTQYQEGMLDIKVHFSDGTITCLSDILSSDYHLSIDTFENGAVAFAPKNDMAYPRILAIGEGKGQLLHVSLEVTNQCQRKRTQPLAMSYVNINVDFSSTPSPTSVQNDAYIRRNNGMLVTKNYSFNSVASSDEDNSSNYEDTKLYNSLKKDEEPSVQPRQNRLSYTNLTPLEIGMYALLGVFSLAVFIFVASCMIFAIRFRGGKQPHETITTFRVGPVQSTTNKPAVANANNWIWLGRATLERNSVKTNCNQTLMSTDYNGNPLIVNLSEPTVRMRENETHVLHKAKRESRISYPGSEISIRITSNPIEANGGDEALCSNNASLSHPTNECSSRETGSLYSKKSLPNTPQQTPPPVPTRKLLEVNSASTYIKTPPIPPHNSKTGIKKESDRQKISSNDNVIAMPPPIPVHSYTRNSKNPKPVPIPKKRTQLKQPVIPPPIPPHKMKNNFQESDGGPRLIRMSNNSASSNINVLSNPIDSVDIQTKTHSIDNDMSIQELNQPTSEENEKLKNSIENKWEDVTKKMNYNQLLEYFVNLKESSA